MAKQNSTEKVIVSVCTGCLALTFVIKLIAVMSDIESIKLFFGLEDPNNKEFFQLWFFIGIIIMSSIGLLVWVIDNKLFKIVSMIPLISYAFLQFAAFLLTAAFGGAGYDDGYVTVDCIWFFGTTVLSAIPAAILGISADWLIINSRIFREFFYLSITLPSTKSIKTDGFHAQIQSSMM